MINWEENKLKRIISFTIIVAMSFALLLSTSGNAQTQELTITKFEIDYDNQLIDVQGNIGVPRSDMMVSLQILKPGTTVASLANTTKSTSELVAYPVQTKTLSAGDFIQPIPFSNMPTGDYTMMISWEKSNLPIVKMFRYSSHDEVETVFNEINSSTDVELFLAKITNYATVLGWDTDVFNSLPNDLKHKICDTIVKADAFTTKEQLKTLYNSSVFIQSLMNASDATKVSSIIASNSSFFQINTLTGYSTFSKISNKDMVYQKFIGSGANNIQDLINTFNQQTVLVAISFTTDWPAVGTIINDNKASLIGFNLVDYENLSDKSVVDKVLTGKTLVDFNDLKTKFNDAVNIALNPIVIDDTPRTNGTGRTVSIPPIATAQPTSTPQVNIPFNDLDSVPWAKESVMKLAELGIVSGKGNSTFAPNDFITREEFAKILVTAFNLVDEGAESNFNDVNSGEWYYKFVSIAQKKGITAGMGDGSFGVGRNITREDLATLLYRAIPKEKFIISSENKPFGDDDKISGYAKEAVYAMHNTGVINGIGENIFASAKFATRAEVAKIIGELLKLMAK
jgi:hypothetical protein